MANASQAEEGSQTRLPGREPVPGRLAVVTGMSLMASAIPLPVLPDRVLRQLRGATAHEVASRHGLSLSTEARDALARPDSDDRMRSLLRKGVELIAKRLLRRLGPLGPLSAAVRAFEVYALGHLMDRYLLQRRTGGPARLQEREARKLRDAIDAAVLHALHPSTTPQPLMLPEGSEDLRDDFTRWTDALVMGTATIPNYLVRRLEAAFDEALPEAGDLLDA